MSKEGKFCNIRIKCNPSCIDNYRDVCFFIIAQLIFIFCALIFQWRDPVVAGLFIVFTAVVTSILALWKYHLEQRTLRLQKLYFEDTLLGQAKSLESMMSLTTKYYLSVESLVNYTINLIDLKGIDIALKKQNLINYFDIIINEMKSDINFTYFKRETISKLLHDVGKNGNCLPLWVEEFENDVFRWACFLKNQLLLLRSKIYRLEASNLQESKKLIVEISKHIKDNYVMIERHYMLFYLLSDFVLEFSSGSYSSIQNLKSFFNNNDKAKRIATLINEIYKELIFNFNQKEVYIFGKNLNETNVREMREKINDAKNKLATDF